MYGCGTHNTSLQGMQTIPVRVGPDLTIFHVHKDLIAGACRFFDKALSSDFKEGKIQKLKPSEYGL